MYYEVTTREPKREYIDGKYVFPENEFDYEKFVINITNIKLYHQIKHRQNVVSIELVEPFIITVKPETMSQFAHRHQSFSLKDVDGNSHGFFNIDDFSKLYKVFTNPKILVYHSNRGGEQRLVILATINENGKEQWFDTIKSRW